MIATAVPLMAFAFKPVRPLAAALGFFVFSAPTVAAEAQPSAPAELRVPATEVLAAVSERYAAASTVSCTVRRTVSGSVPGGGAGSAPETAEMVTKIVWARGFRLNALRIAPSRRRTVINGESVWTAENDSDEPVRFAVVDQLPSQAANLRAVPGSPEESLFPLDPASGRDVVPATAPFARQVSFSIAAPDAEESDNGSGKAGADGSAAAARVVVSFDSDGCVARLEAFEGEDSASPVWTTEFSAPFEPHPGLRLFRRVETTTSVGGANVSVVSTFDRIRVNEPPQKGVFDHAKYFRTKR